MAFGRTEISLIGQLNWAIGHGFFLSKNNVKRLLTLLQNHYLRGVVAGARER